MSKSIQIRHVPDEIHREVTARAALADLSLSDYLLLEIQRLIAAPPVDDLLSRRSEHLRSAVRESAVDAVRRERDGRRSS